LNYRHCPHCLGTGRDPWATMPCQVCKGQGQVRAFPKEQSVVCRYCNETGRDPYRFGPCPVCHGHGVISAGPIEFVHISGSKPYSDRRTIENILEQATGEVRICETYLGMGTLDLLKSLPVTCTVRVLAREITDVSPRDIGTFKTECPSFQFRYRTQRDLHDRYLLDDRGLLILGHGLKDIGKTESFAIFLEKSSNPDILRDILEAFDSRWESATPVQS
jgi:hypothetical protein